MRIKGILFPLVFTSLDFGIALASGPRLKSLRPVRTNWKGGESRLVVDRCEKRNAAVSARKMAEVERNDSDWQW